MVHQDTDQKAFLKLLNDKESFISHLKQNAALEFKTNNIASSSGSETYSCVGDEQITFFESINGDGWCCYVVCFGAYMFSKRSSNDRSTFNKFVGNINKILHSSKGNNEETKQNFQQFIKKNFNSEYLINNSYVSDITASQVVAVNECRGN